jgi:antitoxin (DNA-binding transcriptional repressor) of toxin-antitoxin stability system
MKAIMQTVSATDLARHTREVLDTVVIHGATVIVERNERVIARITPEVPRMTASEALAGLGGVLTPEEADAWFRDSRSDFDESARDPWA